MKNFSATRFPNLARNINSGTYYAVVRVGGGKKVARTLKTKVETVARLRLGGKLAEIRGNAGRVSVGDLTLHECAALYLQSKRAEDLKPRAVQYREQTVAGIKTSWPDFDKTKASSVRESDCETWAKRTRAKSSASWFNGCLQSLRGIFDEAIKAGCCESNPARPITKQRGPLSPARVTIKQVEAYTFEQMELLWAALAKRRGHALLFCRFLYHFTLRLDTVNHLTPSMVDRKNAVFKVPGQWVKGERAGTIIAVPIFPEMFKILDDLDKRFGKNRARLLPTTTALGVLVKCCDEIGLPRLNHHSFRHLFATHALLRGKPIPLVAKWLNHKDGGALLLKRYNHIIDEVSRTEAASLRLA